MVKGSCVPVAAPVAQRTEHRSSEPSVGGSNPSGSAWMGGAHWPVYLASAPSFFSILCDMLPGIMIFL
jgi:hypothetical protein